jgi:type I restriction enzyme, S subunit
MEILQDTYKDTKIGRIPMDWELLFLADIIKKMSDGGTPSRSNKTYFNGNIFWCVISDIQRSIFDTKEKISESGFKNSSTTLWPINSIILSTGATIGKVGINKIQTCTKQGITGIIPDESKVDLYFFYYLLQSIKKLLKRFSQGSTIKEVRPAILAKIPIAIPRLSEQKKIAAILSTVDEQISTTDKIIEKSKELKKGLMQKLFSEGIGHTEFKDTKIGRIPKDWEVVKVGSICKLQGGFAFKSKDSTESGVRWFKIANVGINQVKWKDESFLPSGFDEKHSEFILNEGDIVVAMTRPVLSGKLKICRILKSDSGSLLNQRVGRVVLKDKYNGTYYYQCFNTKRFIDSVEGELFGTDPPNISSKLFESINIPLPSQTEQQKIADILSEADAKIEKEQTQKAQLEALKKGLMQQLLTGKKRVKV